MNLIDYDSWLSPYKLQIEYRHNYYNQRISELEKKWESLDKISSAYNYFGLHKSENNWILREWAPNATEIYLIGDFSNWKPTEEFKFSRKENDEWEISVPLDTLKHNDLYKLWVVWDGGSESRIPSFANYVTQDEKTHIFSARVWDEKPFEWTDEDFEIPNVPPLIYEAHIGMSSEEEKVSNYIEFADIILPRIKEMGYNTIQLMAIQEHPYYGSFGYHVSSFFAPSSRFGTPDDLKYLINKAHNMGIAVIMDIVHSHAVKNEAEGLSKFDGTHHQYFHNGDRGYHPAWDSRCFNYGKDEVIRFLLSNCKYWLDEFHFDGFRFDGVTSMLYVHHGLDKNFTSYADYFTGDEDIDAITYLVLANKVIHNFKPSAISVAEEMSGYPGLTVAPEKWGVGFDYRLSMGIPDLWIKFIKEKNDEEWNIPTLYYELTQRRPEEKVIVYSESHDQALVGDKTILFRLADKELYTAMRKVDNSLIIDRAIALHKMIRLVTITTGYGGYLNFMGNEFGHPEWIDFPREGNNWSYKYARRQWSLADSDELKYKWLGNFDKEMISLIKKHNLLNVPEIYLKTDNQETQILAYSKGNLLFIFNFNPTESYPCYGIHLEAGKYKLILSSDDEKFGGFDRIDKSISYYTEPLENNKSKHQLLVYTPSRTALVFEKQEIKSIFD